MLFDRSTTKTVFVAPPPRVEMAQLRSQSLGDLNIGHSAVIAPAPELAVAEQRGQRHRPEADGAVMEEMSPRPQE
jgi:hypothetical protein